MKNPIGNSILRPFPRVATLATLLAALSGCAGVGYSGNRGGKVYWDVKPTTDYSELEPLWQAEDEGESRARILRNRGKFLRGIGFVLGFSGIEADTATESARYFVGSETAHHLGDDASREASAHSRDSPKKKMWRPMAGTELYVGGGWIDSNRNGVLEPFDETSELGKKVFRNGDALTFTILNRTGQDFPGLDFVLRDSSGIVSDSKHYTGPIKADHTFSDSVSTMFNVGRSGRDSEDMTIEFYLGGELAQFQKVIFAR